MQRRPRRAFRAALLALCTAAWALACAEDEPPPAAPSTAQEPAPQAASPERGRAEAGAGAPQQAGTLEISVVGDRATVVGAGVSRRRVLSELAEKGGFKLSVRNLADRAVDLELRDVPLAEVFAAVLAGDPYSLDYRVDAATGDTVLFRVRVGPPLLAGRARRESKQADAPQRERGDRRIGRQLLRRLLQPRSPDVRARRREQIQNRMEARAEAQEELIAQLEEPEAQDRLAALEQLEMDGAGLEWAAYLAESDPSVDVRRAAVERLGLDGSFGAMTAVVVALDDPAPEVVAEALDVIDRTGDPSMAPLVRPLLDHPDEGVRKRAELVIELYAE